MNHLYINYLITSKEKGIKSNQLATLKTLVKPIIQKIWYTFMDKPVHLNLAKNGRRQITFTRKMNPMKWE